MSTPDIYISFSDFLKTTGISRTEVLKLAAEGVLTFSVTFYGFVSRREMHPIEAALELTLRQAANKLENITMNVRENDIKYFLNDTKGIHLKILQCVDGIDQYAYGRPGDLSRLNCDSLIINHEIVENFKKNNPGFQIGGLFDKRHWPSISQDPDKKRKAGIPIIQPPQEIEGPAQSKKGGARKSGFREAIEHLHNKFLNEGNTEILDKGNREEFIKRLRDSTIKGNRNFSDYICERILDVKMKSGKWIIIPQKRTLNETRRTKKTENSGPYTAEDVSKCLHYIRKKKVSHS